MFYNDINYINTLRDDTGILAIGNQGSRAGTLKSQGKSFLFQGQGTLGKVGKI